METPKENEIHENEIHENEIVNNPDIKIDKDKTFNRLKEIQALLKKESSLNDLCKETT